MNKRKNAANVRRAGQKVRAKQAKFITEITKKKVEAHTKVDLLTQIEELTEALSWKTEQRRVELIEASEQAELIARLKAEAKRLCNVANNSKRSENIAKERLGDTLHTTQTALRCIMEVMGTPKPRLDTSVDEEVRTEALF